MKDVWNKAAVGIAALMCVGAANAFVIDFESGVGYANAPYAPLLSGGDYVTQGAYAIIGQDANNATGTLVAAMINGSDASTCLDGTACPTGDTSHYIAATNDGIVSIQSLNGSFLTLSTFDAAFLPPAGTALGTGQVAYLAVEADRADNSFQVGLFRLNGPNATTGLTAFTTLNAATPALYNGGSTATGTLTSGNITALYFYELYCAGTSCTAFGSDKGQFALDNIALNVAAVPEPADWMLMGLGLAGVGALVRRRATV